MADLPALEGEDWVALDVLPEDAELDEVLAIIADVHLEGIAAVMAEAPAGAILDRSRQLDHELRPRSGVFEVH